jgi:cytochrome c
MRTRSKFIATVMGVVGLLTGLITGSAIVAWLLRPPKMVPALRRGRYTDYKGRRRAVSELEEETLLHAGTSRQVVQPAEPAPRGRPVLRPPVDETDRLEDRSPKPHTRTVRFVATLVVLALLATVAGLVGSAHATSAQQKEMARIMTGGDPDRGKEIIRTKGCGSCHTIPGVRGASALVGPPLTQVGGRAYIAGVLPNTPDNLKRWLLDPPGINPKTAMPNLHLTQEQATDIAAYLYTLR